VSGFLLDTNVLSEFSRTGRPNERVTRWLKSAAEEDLFVSVLTVAEIRRGIELLPAGKRRMHLEEWLEDLLVAFEMRLLPVNLRHRQSLGNFVGERPTQRNYGS
jgi:predicted nucleic acid-binding protein